MLVHKFDDFVINVVIGIFGPHVVQVVVVFDALSPRIAWHVLPRHIEIVLLNRIVFSSVNK